VERTRYSEENREGDVEGWSEGGIAYRNEDREIKVVKQKKFAEIFAALCLSCQQHRR
jgi:hypothetical protein